MKKYKREDIFLTAFGIMIIGFLVFVLGMTCYTESHSEDEIKNPIYQGVYYNTKTDQFNIYTCYSIRAGVIYRGNVWCSMNEVDSMKQVECDKAITAFKKRRYAMQMSERSCN